MSATLSIPARFCGPPGSGNGGYVAGRLAGLVGPGPVEVSLRLPPPLETELIATTDDDSDDATDDGAHHPPGVRLLHDGLLVAEARPAGASPDPVEPVEPAQAHAAAAAFPGHRSHPFPGCFGCGTERADGLRIFPGPVPPGPTGEPRMAATWTPDVSLETSTDADGTARTSPAMAWAALDCIGGWAGGVGERLMVLARITACVDTRPIVGEPHVLTGRAVAHEGRKATTASTLWDAEGRVVGTARHLWVEVDPARFTDRRVPAAATR